MDAVYDGGTSGTAADDVLAKLLPGAGNQGGFLADLGERSGCPRGALHERRYLTGPTLSHPETGRFTYFGDNRRPGKELHDTPRRGNALLRSVFDATHGEPHSRGSVPPFLVFEKVGNGRLAPVPRPPVHPEGPGITANEDLVAIWRTSGGQRFQNYRAIFTVLDVPRVPRAWLGELRAGAASPDGPWGAFRKWVKDGTYLPLRAPPTTRWRSKERATPTDTRGLRDRRGDLRLLRRRRARLRGLRDRALAPSREGRRDRSRSNPAVRRWGARRHRALLARSAVEPDPPRLRARGEALRARQRSWGARGRSPHLAAAPPPVRRARDYVLRRATGLPGAA